MEIEHLRYSLLLKIAAGGQVHFAPAFSARVRAVETRVNQGARALWLHVNRRPRSQPATQPASLAPSQPAAQVFVEIGHLR